MLCLAVLSILLPVGAQATPAADAGVASSFDAAALSGQPEPVTYPQVPWQQLVALLIDEELRGLSIAQVKERFAWLGARQPFTLSDSTSLSFGHDGGALGVWYRAPSKGAEQVFHSTHLTFMVQERRPAAALYRGIEGWLRARLGRPVSVRAGDGALATRSFLLKSGWIVRLSEERMRPRCPPTKYDPPMPRVVSLAVVRRESE